MFKLYEIATFIYDCHYSVEEVEFITKFVNKTKSNYNVSRNVSKNYYINPNEHISLKIFYKTYDIYIEKKKHLIDTIV